MKLNKKMIIMMASVVGVLAVLIIVIMLFAGGGRKKVLKYSAIEEKIVSAGTRYYANNPNKLPQSGTVTIDVDTLAVDGYIKDLSNYTSEEVDCDGKLTVTSNPNGYSYRARLDCGSDYKTKLLSDVVLDDVVDSGNGLYLETQVNPNNNLETIQVYVFKGDSVNNYIKVGDYFWRIIKVYENGEIAALGPTDLFRSTWDNRYNIDTGQYDGINDYKVSRVKENINSNIVDNDKGYLKIKSLITTHTSCIGSRNLNNTSRDGNVECSKTLSEQYFSLMPIYDFVNASLDSNCKKPSDASCYNYNYLASAKKPWWTITAVSENTEDVYYIKNFARTDRASATQEVRLYVHLDPNVSYVSGTGSYNDPYIVK